MRSTLSIAFSRRSRRVLFSTSRRSNTATRSSSRARALRSWATISLAWLNNCAVSSSSSELACDNCDSAARRRLCSRSSALCSSAVWSGLGCRDGGWETGCAGVWVGDVLLGPREWRKDVRVDRRPCELEGGDRGRFISLEDVDDMEEPFREVYEAWVRRRRTSCSYSASFSAVKRSYSQYRTSDVCKIIVTTEKIL